MTYVSRVAFVVLFLCSATAFAETDMQVWSNLGVQHNFNRRFRISFEQHIRFDDNASRLNALMPELVVDYRARRWLRFGTGYRLSYKRTKSGDRAVRHRFHAYGQAVARLGSFRAGYRLRWQELLLDAGNGLRHSLRNRAVIRWRAAKNLSFATSAETFHRVADGNGIQYRKFRVTVGGQRRIGETAVELYYRIEIPRKASPDPILHIFGLGFRYRT